MLRPAEAMQCALCTAAAMGAESSGLSRTAGVFRNTEQYSRKELIN